MNNKKYVTMVCAINDYSIIQDRTSEFLYTPIDVVEAFAMRKHDFEKIMKHPYARMIIPAVKKRYKEMVQKPLNIHRKDLSRKY
jgi:hypothetical protein